MFIFFFAYLFLLFSWFNFNYCQTLFRKKEFTAELPDWLTRLIFMETICCTVNIFNTQCTGRSYSRLCLWVSLSAVTGSILLFVVKRSDKKVSLFYNQLTCYVSTKNSDKTCPIQLHGLLFITLFLRPGARVGADTHIS